MLIALRPAFGRGLQIEEDLSEIALLVNQLQVILPVIGTWNDLYVHTAIDWQGGIRLICEGSLKTQG